LRGFSHAFFRFSPDPARNEPILSRKAQHLNTYATNSIRIGDPIKTVSENLGHATVAFTLDIYGHVTPQMKRESADRMQRLIDAP
jgi:integrase